MTPNKRKVTRALIAAAAILALSGCGEMGNEVGRSDALKNPSAALNPVDLNWEAPSSEGIEILPEVTPIADLELERWLGTWYQVANIPAWFDAFCVAGTTANYSLNATGDVIVRNGCYDRDGVLREQIGLAKLRDAAEPARLSVAFFGLDPAEVGADYWVLDRDGYDFAVVGEPSREYGWVLSRTPTVTQAQVDRALAVLVRQGYDPGDFVPTDQTPSLKTSD